MKQFTRVEPTTTQVVGNKYKREVIIKQFRSDDGKLHEFTTIYKEGSRAGAVIAVTRDGQVVIVHQFRAGPERWMYDIPGGGINEGEDPQSGAIRELREEAGYQPGEVTFLGTSSREAYSNCTWYYYLATNCERYPQGRDLDDEESDQGAEVHFITINELIDNAKHDRMTDSVAVLMAYDKLKEIADDTSN